MSEEITPKGTEEDKSTEAGEEKGGAPTTIPYSRFSTVVAERNASAEKLVALEAKLAELNKVKSDEEEAEAIKRGEFESTLMKYKEQNQALQKRADAFDAYELEQRSMLTGKLPENKQDFAKNMSLLDLSKFVDMEVDNKIVPREDALPGGRKTMNMDVASELAVSNPKEYMKLLRSGAFKGLV